MNSIRKFPDASIKQESEQIKSTVFSARIKGVDKKIKSNKNKTTFTADDHKINTGNPYVTNNDAGFLEYCGAINLEIPIRIDYDKVKFESIARNAYADIIVDSVKHLIGSSQWILLNVLPSATTNSSYIDSAMSFSGQRLAADKQLLNALKVLVSKSGIATVDACMLIAEKEQRPSMETLKKTLIEAVKKAERRARGTGPAKKDTNYDNDEDNEFDYFNSIDILRTDITSNDLPRLVAESEVSKDIQNLTTTSVKSYVPCRLVFTLLGWMPPQVVKTRRGIVDKAKSDTSESLSIGTIIDLQRLIGSTLWLSREAGRSIWYMASVIAKNEKLGIPRYLTIEAKRKNMIFRKQYKEGFYLISVTISYFSI